MSEPTPRTWTVDECIDAMERSGIITNAFTLEERELARTIAAAWYFVWYQQELPGRYLEEKNGVDTAEFSSLQQPSPRHPGSSALLVSRVTMRCV
jgi:hypothetical protein